MTKHEFHIALLLLALIIAGVLGYQFVNSEIDNRTNAWSNALLNSNPDNRHFDIEIEIQHPAHLGYKAHQDTSAVNNSRGDGYRYSEIPGFFNVDEGSMNFSAASNSQTDYSTVGSNSTEHSQINGSYLNSDAHRESIFLILGGSSAEQTTGPLFSTETLLQNIPEEMNAGRSNDP